MQRLNPIKSLRSATMGGWVKDGDGTFVKKRYGKTRLGGFFILCKSDVRLPFFIPYAF